jgi:hypothetical protein
LEPHAVNNTTATAEYNDPLNPLILASCRLLTERESVPVASAVRWAASATHVRCAPPSGVTLARLDLLLTIHEFAHASIHPRRGGRTAMPQVVPARIAMLVYLRCVPGRWPSMERTGVTRLIGPQEVRCPRGASRHRDKKVFFQRRRAAPVC